MLLWTDRCRTSPPALLLSPAVPLSLFLPVGSLYPSIHLSPSLPSVFTPPSSFGPLPLSASLRGKECRVCVAWQRARSHHPPPFLLPHPSLFSLFSPSHPLLSTLALSSIPPLRHLSSILLLVPPFVPVTLSTCF